MTSAAANSFNPDSNQTDSRAYSRVTPQIQTAQLLRTANLSDWNSAQADIQLIPSSCIDNYQNLVVNRTPIQLLAAGSKAENAGSALKPAALITRHQSGKLALRCRKLEIESSSTSHPIQYKVYLAAGFVVHKVNGNTRRLPILLIPVSISRLRGRGSSYVIQYLSDSLLRLNPQVAELCNTQVEQLIKPLESKRDLHDFLLSIKRKLHTDLNCTISANTGILSLQAEVLGEFTPNEIIDIELDRTKQGFEFKPLPEAPEAFDPQLALRMLRFIDQDKLTAALQNFSGQSKQQSVEPVLDVEPDLDTATLEKYYNCAGWLVDVGLGHWQLKNIATLPKRVENMVEDINNLLYSDTYQHYFRKEYRTLDMLFRLSAVKAKILNAPPEMQHHSISLHADADTRLLLQKAKIQAASLEHEMQEINDTLDMSSVPSSAALHKLVKTISMREEESQLTNPSYFRARRQLNEILKTHHGVITENDLQRLERLTKTLRFAELFSDDAYYKRCFGSLFKGTDTNWQRLDSVINYVRSLSQDLGSSKLVAEFSDRWGSFERDFREIETTVENAAKSAHKLSSLIPMFIKPDTQLVHAARTAEKFYQRVNQWQLYLHRNMADTNLTPYQLLSNVDLGDHNHPTIALSQQEYDDRIYTHIVGSGLTSENVSATAEWLLNVVDRLQMDLPTVRRFLDKEAELALQLA